MVYRNPYQGYSDQEYGYTDDDHLKGHYGRYNGQAGHTNHGQYAQEEYIHQNGYSTQLADSGDVWRTTDGGQQGQHGHHGHHQTSTYRVQSNPSPQSSSGRSIVKSQMRRERWPGSLDFLASSWSFTLSLHSVWSLPIAVIQHGGIVFVLVYILLTAVLGAPLLLLEIFLGQYSALAPASLYRHLSPVMAGTGLAICVQAAVRAVLELGLMMWFGQLMFRLFYSRDSITADTDLFRSEIVSGSDVYSLDQVGNLSTQLVLVLGIAALILLVVVVAGSRSVGKVSMVCLPLAFMLLVTLVIRSCLAEGGPQGVLSLLSPEWSLLKEPSLWLQAAAHVIFSLQLGLGAQSNYARCNKYRHNLIRDVAVIIVSHVVWVLLALLLTLALLGAGDSNVRDSAQVIRSVTGEGLWLVAITILDKSLLTLGYGWLWAGLYLVLLTVITITSLYGYIEVISTSFSYIRPGLAKLKPLVTFCVLVLIFLMDLALATQGGIHVYHLLYTYLATWPTLLISFITLLAAVLSHSPRHIVRDLAEMSGVSLPHTLTAHLTVIYTTTAPLLLLSAAAYSLYRLHLDHLEDPLASFGVSLSQSGWPMILGWSLYGLTVLPIVLGILVRLAWVTRGDHLSMHLKRSVSPTDEWYRNEQAHLPGGTRQSSSA